MPLIDVPTIHAVTNAEVLADPAFVARATAVLRAVGPAAALHLRGAGIAAHQLYAQARALVTICRETGSWLIVNDRTDVALAASAGGVQLPRHSLLLADARAVAPALAFGASVHDAVEAAAAFADGATWVIAGNVFQTSSHPQRPPRGLPWLGEIVTASTGPVVAIGGVLRSHVPSIRALGAHGIATISGIWGDRDPGEAARRYLETWDLGLGT